MSRKIRSAVLVLVLVNFFAPAANALPLAERQGASRSESVFTAAWEWLGSLLGPVLKQPVPRAAWEKEGSSMDPNGGLKRSLVSHEVVEVALRVRTFSHK